MLYNLLKSFFNKFNAFVQWTKKSYFWHPLIGSNLGFVFFNTTLSLIKNGWDETWNILPSESVYHTSIIEGFGTFLVFILIFCFFTLPFSIFINILAKIIYKILIFLHIIKKQPCCITNKFLLYNKWYNMYYTLSFAILSFSCIFIIILYIVGNA